MTDELVTIILKPNAMYIPHRLNWLSSLMKRYHSHVEVIGYFESGALAAFNGLPRRTNKSLTGYGPHYTFFVPHSIRGAAVAIHFKDSTKYPTTYLTYIHGERATELEFMRAAGWPETEIAQKLLEEYS